MRNDIEKYNKTREKIDMSNIKKLRKEKEEKEMVPAYLP